MFVGDIKKDFYGELIGKRILLLVNHDVDAICACRILHCLLRADSVVYTLVPIEGIKDLETAYKENSDQVKCVVLINCGGNIDIVEALQPEEDVKFFILDSHRPFDVCNVYNNTQVFLVSNEEDGIPEFDQIFRDDESEEENEESEGSGEEESRQAKRRRLGEEAILKRRERRLWEENRNRIMFEYTQFSYYGRSSAVEMFELAWKLSKDDNEMLWWCIVGVTEQLLMGKIENQQYVLETGNLQNHVARLSQHQNMPDDDFGNDEIQRLCPKLKITYTKDLLLALYRHWTVESSLRYSVYPSCKLRLWTLKGEKKMNELLVEMGLPLAQSRQKFSSMDLDLRQEFHSKMEKMGEKYEMDGIVYASFTLQHGFRGRYCAADVVYAMLALLEHTGKDRLPADCFMDALDCLSRNKRDVLEDGIEKAKKLLMCIFRHVQSMLEMRLVISAGPFLYMVLQEGSIDVKMFSRPHSLALLAQFALQAYVAVSRNKKAHGLPMVASAPLDPSEGTCLVVGVPPVSEDSPKNFFGKAFEQAAIKIRARMTMDCFDTSIVQLKTDDRAKFFDALTTLLS
ncbi:cell division control protein 45 homolog [Schistocerca piceifrons]|uniref:cell division control protein 45 homolog n=1 Tax=Schistocerca piceifrons TaxID=274613 RepID=UPI001F5FA2BA|nr:cell division control protein 45 homolog [Schistocerca piceifrons]XP_049838517.1 cell division control protein 45 homolog [Schistocerca gregaria]